MSYHLVWSNLVQFSSRWSRVHDSISNPTSSTLSKMAKQVKLPRVSKDHYARVSYLFQAASFYASRGVPVMSNMMARNVDLVSKRTVLKLLPHLKRTMCKKCFLVLIPGLTLSMKIENRLKEHENKGKSPKADVLVHSCLKCNNQKRYPIGKDPEYKLFCEKEGILY